MNDSQNNPLDNPHMKDGVYLDDEGLTEYDKMKKTLKGFYLSGMKHVAMAMVLGIDPEAIVDDGAIDAMIDDTMEKMVKANVMPNIVEKNITILN